MSERSERIGQVGAVCPRGAGERSEAESCDPELARDAGVDAETVAPLPQAGFTGPPARPSRLGPHIDVDRHGVERGLGNLVLTIIELLRQLMERQALRRIDQGDLTDEQIERIGMTLMALDEQMAELREHFGLTPEDLNLDLGPLGPLLPRD